jgi:hypothetical protein
MGGAACACKRGRKIIFGDAAHAEAETKSIVWRAMLARALDFSLDALSAHVLFRARDAGAPDPADGVVACGSQNCG